ncbi:IST1 homolog [Caerostris extrusa]|uniref:IST1 homolog n=1 Tax=Caerostris extrusa TaxID=172846 RepID=A0AAV4V6X9_CAEEX|nr:IST1 homolog [Caerostris extrusa]
MKPYCDPVAQTQFLNNTAPSEKLNLKRRTFNPEKLPPRQVHAEPLTCSSTSSITAQFIAILEKALCPKLIKVQSVIRYEATQEAMEIIEMFCEQILDRYGVFEETKEIDKNLEQAISSLIWVSPLRAIRISLEDGEYSETYEGYGTSIPNTLISCKKAFSNLKFGKNKGPSVKWTRKLIHDNSLSEENEDNQGKHSLHIHDNKNTFDEEELNNTHKCKQFVNRNDTLTDSSSRKTKISGINNTDSKKSIKKKNLECKDKVSPTSEMKSNFLLSTYKKKRYPDSDEPPPYDVVVSDSNSENFCNESPYKRGSRHTT